MFFSSKKGFTLVELTITLALTSIATVLIIGFVTSMNLYVQQTAAMTEVHDFVGDIREQSAVWVAWFDHEEYYFDADESSVSAIRQSNPEERYRMYFEDGCFYTEYPGQEPVKSASTQCFEGLDPTIQTNEEGQVLFRLVLSYTEYGKRLTQAQSDRYSWFLTSRTRAHTSVLSGAGGA